MGQGQADVALQLLRDCSINGDWLCLKNLHLVTSTVIRNTMHLHLYLLCIMCTRIASVTE